MSNPGAQDLFDREETPALPESNQGSPPPNSPQPPNPSPRLLPSPPLPFPPMLPNPPPPNASEPRAHDMSNHDESSTLPECEQSPGSVDADRRAAVPETADSINNMKATDHVIATPIPVVAARRRVSYEGWKQDVIDTHTYLTKVAGAGLRGKSRRFGADWLDCVAEWAELQGGVFTGANLPTYAAIRPQEIGFWLKSCRPWKEVPIKDAAYFSASWDKWWSAILPVSRASLNSNEADWRRLDKMGKNGLVLVMVSLVWWGECTQGNTSWLTAVREVTQVLRKVRAAAAAPRVSAETPTATKKRKGRHDDNDDQHPPRPVK